MRGQSERVRSGRVGRSLCIDETAHWRALQTEQCTVCVSANAKVIFALPVPLYASGYLPLTQGQQTVGLKSCRKTKTKANTAPAEAAITPLPQNQTEVDWV